MDRAFSPSAAGAAASLALIFALIAFGPAAVEGQRRWTPSILAGVALPTGDFGDDASPEAGLATAGLSLGLGLEVPIGNVPNLSWMTSAEALTFGVDDAFLSDLLPSVEIDFGRYWTAVLFTGARYDAEASPSVAVYALAQVGLGGFKAPGADISGFGEAAELVTFWKLARGWTVGGGLTLNRRVDVELRYAALVNPEISGELRYLGTTEPVEGDQPVSWLRVGAAIRLR
jgi:hypothetical protein